MVVKYLSVGGGGGDGSKGHAIKIFHLSPLEFPSTEKNFVEIGHFSHRKFHVANKAEWVMRKYMQR